MKRREFLGGVGVITAGLWSGCAAETPLVANPTETASIEFVPFPGNPELIFPIPKDQMASTWIFTYENWESTTVFFTPKEDTDKVPFLAVFGGKLAVLRGSVEGKALHAGTEDKVTLELDDNLEIIVIENQNLGMRAIYYVKKGQLSPEIYKQTFVKVKKGDILGELTAPVQNPPGLDPKIYGYWLAVTIEKI